MKTLKTPKLDELTPEKMQFLQQRFEEVMERLLGDRESLDRKAGFVFAIISAILSFGIGNLVGVNFSDEPALFVFLSAECFILMILAARLAWACLLPSHYHCQGGEPDQLLKPEFWRQSTVRMQYGYSILLQDRINANRTINARKASIIRRIALVATLSPLVASLATGVLLWLSYLSL